MDEKTIKERVELLSQEIIFRTIKNDSLNKEKKYNLEQLDRCMREREKLAKLEKEDD